METITVALFHHDAANGGRDGGARGDKSDGQSPAIFPLTQSHGCSRLEAGRSVVGREGRLSLLHERKGEERPTSTTRARCRAMIMRYRCSY